MPVSWTPRRLSLRDDIERERIRLDISQERRSINIPTRDEILPTLPSESIRPPLEQLSRDTLRPTTPLTPIQPEVVERPAFDPFAQTTQPPQQVAQPIRQPVLQQATQLQPKIAEAEDPEPANFLMRALQVFSAPFEWVDENIIKPGLAVAGTETGLVKDVERKAGEDYFEWKKRSWDALETPGIDINVPWSNDPLRLDVKGVLEFAPWFLIPGAGIAGTATRAGFGIAGALGKAGKVGKALGRAVEYSPWGLTEKVAGKALGATLRGAGVVGTKLGEKAFGKYVEPPQIASVQKLTKDLKELILPARKAFEAVKPTLTAKQTENLSKIESQFNQGKINATQRQLLEDTALGVGKLKPQFAVKVGGTGRALNYTGKEMDEILGVLYNKVENGNFEARDAAGALKRLLSTGELPEPRHFVQWSKAYGVEAAKVLRDFTKKPLTAREKAIDLLNLPRAVLASGDLSGTFRQGLILVLTHPTKFPRAFYRQLKGFASEKLGVEMDDALRSHPLYREAVSDGVEFTALRKGAAMTAKEEPFSSNIAQALPFVRKSERAFTTFLNEMRMGTYESAHAAMMAQGATKVQRKLMGEFINLAGGRGTLPANLDRYAPVLNTVLFSAKYQLSTLQLPRQIGRMLLSGNPYMRKEAAKALVTFVGGGTALVSLLQATGQGKVNTDPRSGDFGKIVIGKTRLDIWRGYIQYARFAAQLLTGERKSANGNLNKDDRFNIAFRFLQGKASPAAGLMVDLLRGESYMGEPLFDETTGFIKTARDRLLPLAVQDTIDAMEQYGANGLWFGLPAATGIGVLTYVNDLVRVKERIAREEGFDSWDDIDPKTQREIQNRNLELQTAYLELDRQVMGTAWGDWKNAGNSVEDVFKENVGLASEEYRATGDGVLFRDKIGKAYVARSGGYAAREKEDRFEDIVKRLNIKDVVEADVALGPEQLAIKVYNDTLWGDDMYDEFGNYRYDEATIRKEQLKEQLGEERFSYVEEYRGLKNEDLPPEFHLLAQAKVTMRPYWAIQTKVEQLFGKTFMESSRGQSLISKQRKQMRQRNPEIEMAYQLFYSTS